MELKSFIESFAAQFDESDDYGFTSETKFKELDEWSSIVALMIIAMIDEEYHVIVSSDELRSVDTIEEVFNLVREKYV